MFGKKEDQHLGIPDQKLFPCASCNFDVNSDKKCTIRDRPMHVFCSVARLVDGEGDAIHKRCSIKPTDKPLEQPPCPNESQEEVTKGSFYFYFISLCRTILLFC
jgi:hypothetical protein